ncbi:GDP-perosamine synthase [Halioglobus japonicus]|nr:GDP-perosamine synthase [Halioglobus japonicus]
MSVGDKNNTERVAAAKPLFSPGDIERLKETFGEVLESGRLILGEQTQGFEEEFKTFVGAEHAVAVSSCTAAIQIALRYHNIQGREVILPTNNFVGVVSAVIAEGGQPVLAEMDPNTFCGDTDDIIARITDRTAGIIVVHIAGLISPDIKRLRQVCDERGLFLLEDASHAHGAKIDGQRSGALTDVGCFSFYPTKILTTCVGGMLTTRNPELAAYARSVRHHGVGGSLEDIVLLGNNWCMSELHAALGRSQLQQTDANVDHRNRMVARYRQGLQDKAWLTIPVCPDNIRHAYYKFPTLLAPEVDCLGFRRMLFEDYGIENGAIYNPPCHLQPVLRQKYGFSEGLFPVAEATLSRQLCPPIHSGITESEVDRSIASIIAVARRFGLE